MSNTVNPNSIRQTVIGMLMSGADTKAITATVQEKFPESAAAKKSVKHIAWYRATLRKSGQLGKDGKPVTVVTAANDAD